jgi:hypothetical protein
MSMRIYAAVAAAIGWFALALQLVLIVTVESDISVTGRVVNFFSYFTILSNILVAIALSAVAYGATRSALVWPSVQTGLALYIAVTGITYFVILRHVWEPTGWARVADQLLHYLMPILYLLFWALFVKKGTLSFRSVPWFLIFPIGYAAYTLIRGPGVRWYPYPFIDASALSASELVINITVLVVAFAVIAVLLVAIGRGMGRARITPA